MNASQEVVHLRSEWIENEDGSTYLATGFDVAHGYAFTVHKVQGASLNEGILVFEHFAPEGWGYTALTRFTSRARLLCLGDVSPQHFQPRTL